MRTPISSRLEWDAYFMLLAHTVASRSTCLRRQVGAVAVDTSTHRILGTGYNGNIPHYPHCTPDTCVRMKENIPSGQQLDRCYAVHAEQNIILTLGIDKLSGATLYCTNKPCLTCLKLILSCNFKRIVWESDYPDRLSDIVMEGYGNVTTTASGFHQLIKSTYTLPM